MPRTRSPPGASLDAIIEKGYFGKTGGEVLCFGAGGSGVATLLHLINKKDKGDRPRKFTFVNRSQGRLDHAQGDGREDWRPTSRSNISATPIPLVNDKIMEKFPPYSIIINATGMGKDTPGSPITWEGSIPHEQHRLGVQLPRRTGLPAPIPGPGESRKVKVEDGWLYFVHGWTQVVAQVLHFDLTPELFDRLNEAASTVRGK